MADAVNGLEPWSQDPGVVYFGRPLRAALFAGGPSISLPWAGSDGTNSSNASGIQAAAEEWLCEGQPFFAVWDDATDTFPECMSCSLPVASASVLLLLLALLQAFQGREPRHRGVLQLPRLTSALLRLGHVVILTCATLTLARRELLPQHDVVEALRVERIYYWSLPLVWGVSYCVIFVGRRAVDSGAVVLFWNANALASAPRLYNLWLLGGPAGLDSALVWDLLFSQVIVAAVWCVHLVAWCMAQAPSESVGNKQSCPMHGAGPINRLLFSWCWPLVKLGASRPLELSDVWASVEEDSVEVNAELFDRYWRRHCPSLVRALYVMYWKPFLLCGVMQAASAVLDFLGPVMLGKFVELASQDDDPAASSQRTLEGLGYVVALTVGRGMSAFLQQHTQFLISRLGLRVSGGLKSGVYTKLLRLSAEERQARSAGDMVNLLTVDVQRVVGAATGLWNALVLPAQIVVAMLLLWNVMGASMLAGLLGMVGILGINYVIADYTKTVTKDLMEQKDARMKATTEMLNGMRQIKMAAQELRFRDSILKLREVELDLIWRQLLLGALNIFLLWMAPLLISVSSFAAYTLWAGRVMAPSKVFTALALFRLLQEPLRSLPGFVMQLVQAWVSLDRLALFLVAHELQRVQEAGAIGQQDAMPTAPRHRPLASSSSSPASAGTLPAMARHASNCSTANARRTKAGGDGESVGAHQAGDTVNIAAGARDVVGARERRRGGGGGGAARAKVGAQTEVNQWIKGQVVLKDVEFSWFDPKTEEERRKKLQEDQKKLKEKKKMEEIERREAKRKELRISRQGVRQSGLIPVSPDVSFHRPQQPAQEANGVRVGVSREAGEAEPAQPHDSTTAARGEASQDGDKGPVLKIQGDVTIPAGTLTLVIGRVGSGKSSLLHAVAGQLNHAPLGSASASQRRIGAGADGKGKMSNHLNGLKPSIDSAGPKSAPRQSGDRRGGLVVVGGNVALCCQTPWIQNLTIRDNIVKFQCAATDVSEGDDEQHGDARGHDQPETEGTDEERYARVVRACQLQDDFEQLPAGDETEIGEKGVTLSGGQKWRVSLARAAYSPAPILALDDPLSALDARVAVRVFDDLIVGFLGQRTRLVATNQLEHALNARVDSLLVLDGQEGRLTKIAGRASGASCRDIVTALQRLSFHLPEQAVEKALKAEATESRAGAPLAEDVTSASKPESAATSKAAGGGGGALVQEEERETGKVSPEVYIKYLRAVGGWQVAFLLLGIQTIWQLMQVGSDWWLSSWSQESEQEQREAGAQQRSLLIYALLSLGAALSVLARTLIVSSKGLRGARALFEWQTEAVVKAPIRFFDTTPVGRIINRATEDQNSVDTQLCFAFGSLLAQGFSMLGLVLTTAAITKYMLIPVVPMLLIYCKVTAIYLESSRELQRIQSIAKSPVLSHVSASASGAATIRAFGAVTRSAFVARFVQLLDEQQEATFAGNAATQWFSLRLRLIGVLVLLFTTGSLNLLRGSIPSGLVGLAVSYGLMAEDVVSNLVFYWQWLENSMVSPERILQYADIESEAALEESASSIHRAGSSWPSRGCVEFVDVVMAYGNKLDPVLRHLSFRAEGGSMVGIVGRTGAGKSSIAAAIFRLVELRGGCIRIDGIDISSLALHTLRGRLAIVAQDPILFAGPLISYLDPFGLHDKQAVWQALEQVNLKAFFASKPDGLRHELSEDGANLSQGQRQLVCLARVLLCRAKVVVMDEATAAMDDGTDLLVQRTVRERFRDSTLLIIAHRIKTIIDCHQIIVMDQGKCIEQGPPLDLLRRGRDCRGGGQEEGGGGRSMFAALAGETGARYLQEMDAQRGGVQGGASGGNAIEGDGTRTGTPGGRFDDVPAETL